MAIISSTRLERREGACKNFCLPNIFTSVIRIYLFAHIGYICLNMLDVFVWICWIHLWRHIVWGGSDCEIALILCQAENEIFSVLSYNKFSVLSYNKFSVLSYNKFSDLSCNKFSVLSYNRFSVLSCYTFWGNNSKYKISQDLETWKIWELK